MDSNPTLKTVSLEDILVVAPFNAQVQALRKSLPEGALVGTVDKFKGKEAPIVIYSMDFTPGTTVRCFSKPKRYHMLWRLAVKAIKAVRLKS